MPRPSILGRVAAAVLAAAATQLLPAPPAAQEPPPFELGLEERVEVQYVLLDVVVVDRHGRTIPGLTSADFDLQVDGDPVEIATLDETCPWGAADEVPPDARSAPDGRPADPARVILAFDYYHMENAALALEAADAALGRWARAGTEHMVVSLGQVTRIQLPWTDDLEAVRETLRRMRADPTLYFGPHGQLTDWPFFKRLDVLYDVLERMPGNKILVLFSGPFHSDGWHHDLEYRDLAAMAANARAPIYPVDSGGMRGAGDIGAAPLGGPAKLRRLATETGGRMTADTNDIGVAYAQAQRDLGCKYTLGFHDRLPRLDRPRRVVIHVPSRFGARVHHPAAYVVRSREARRESLVATAAVTPELFDNAAIDADLRLIGVRESGKWDARMNVTIARAPAGWENAESWRLQLIVRRPTGALLKRFEREVVPQAEDFAWSEEVTLRPGRYTIAAVLSAPGVAEPIAALREVSVPEASPCASSPGSGAR